MPKLIFDTSPLQYLYQLELINLIPKLSDTLLVPEAVVKELEAGRALGVKVPNVKEYEWLSVTSTKSLPVLPLVTDLGKGEVEALALALELKDCVSVLDDKLARTFAQALNLPYTGTLGLLLDAKREGLIPAVSPLLDQLGELNFRLNPNTAKTVLRLAGEA